MGFYSNYWLSICCLSKGWKQRFRKMDVLVIQYRFTNFTNQHVYGAISRCDCFRYYIYIYWWRRSSSRYCTIYCERIYKCARRRREKLLILGIIKDENQDVYNCINRGIIIIEGS